MARKKGKKGVPDTNWSETKKRVNITITPSGIALARERMRKLGITSLGEVIDRWARNIAIGENDSTLTLTEDVGDQIVRLFNSVSFTMSVEILKRCMSSLQQRVGKETIPAEPFLTENEVKDRFIRKLANRTIASDDLTDLSETINLTDEEFRVLGSILKNVSNKGGKKTNGV